MRNLNITDIDGNTYKSVIMGTQEWMAENLNVSSYRNGDSITNVTDKTKWQQQATGAYSDYNNTPSYSTTYGKLYNFFSVVDSRNLCPTGWHIPKIEEWNLLITYIGEPIGNTKLRETGTAHWNSPNRLATNITGFTALPGGSRNFAGIYGQLGSQGNWWTSTKTTSSTVLSIIKIISIPDYNISFWFFV